MMSSSNSPIRHWEKCLRTLSLHCYIWAFVSVGRTLSLRVSLRSQRVSGKHTVSADNRPGRKGKKRKKEKKGRNIVARLASFDFTFSSTINVGLCSKSEPANTVSDTGVGAPVLLPVKIMVMREDKAAAASEAATLLD